MMPSTLMRRLSDEMDRMVADTFAFSRFLGNGGTWSPPIEVRQMEGDLEVIAELPSMQKTDVRVEYTPDGLIIEGDSHSQRSHDHFFRTIPLPQGSHAEQAKAEFKDGLLQVHVPIPGGKQPTH